MAARHSFLGASKGDAMPTVGNVQKQIKRVEGFDVRFLHQGPGPTPGGDVRDDRTGIPGYPYLRAAQFNISVALWIDRRFRTIYPGFDVEVLDGNGKVVSGKKHLDTVRATYD